MSEELRTPQEWAELAGLYILDPDGWREADAPPFDQPCTQGEYKQRVGWCTVGPLPL